MARSTMDFAQQSTERAVQTTNWMRAMAEQSYRRILVTEGVRRRRLELAI
jgi:hypothetical protein